MLNGYVRYRDRVCSCSTVTGCRARKVSLAKLATSIIFVAPKHVFCRNKSMLVTTNLLLCLSRQNTSQSMLVATNFCHDKHVFCRGKHMFCGDKIFFSRQNMCLPRQNVPHKKRRRYLWQLPPTTVRQRGSAAFAPTLYGV